MDWESASCSPPTARLENGGASAFQADPVLTSTPDMGSVPPSPSYSPSAPSLRLIGRYLLCDAIASGGMATVHLGRLVGPQGFSRTVAIKQLYHHFSRDGEFVAMFLDEARILSRIRHPHVVAPLDVVVLDGELFIVMEYVHGASLAELMDACNGPLPPRIASAIVGQMLLGLHAAHEATAEGGEPLSIVHRDVSPHNVLVGGDGIARVVDFGISKAQSRARTTGDGSIKGKLGYMAPEQLQSKPVDRRTDLFTSAIVLWETLTGQRLFVADNIVALFDRLMKAEVPAPSSLVNVPPELDRLVLRTLSLDPDQRAATAREMAAELERVLPPAGTLELSSWVESLVGPILDKRADRIAALESIDIADLTLARPRSLSPVPTRTAPLPTPALDATIEAPAMFGGTLQMTAALSGVPVSRDLTDPAVVVPPRKRRRAWLALPAALAVIGAGAYSFGHTPRSDAPAAAATAITPKPSVTLASSLPEPSVPRTLEAEPAHSETEAENAAVASSAPQKPKPGARTPPKAAAPAVSKPSATKPAASKPAATKPEANDAARNPCAVPYTLDDHGVKRFKPECFR
ncbi:MAG: protein kinase [Polyangiaceae bacterium]